MPRADRPAPSVRIGRFGPYEVLGFLGAGGMGEVYRARDARLRREVALKVLPPAFASDPARLARFRREAHVLASMSHPCIAAIHGLEESEGQSALVLELVEGTTLSQRITQGPLPVSEALEIAGQIAAALEAAHEQGIVHRDLKPGNVMLRSDGAVKVLDFGVAKALVEEVSSGGDVLTYSPTRVAPAMTSSGMILGTAAYMSPEQARGQLVDKRTDLWALGCVLYEMLAGVAVFVGESVTDVLAAVVTAPPDWSRLPAETPAGVRTLLRRCLEKDRRQRLDSATAARLELRDAALAPSAGSATASKAESRLATVGVPRWAALAAGSVLLLLVAVVGVVAWQSLGRAPAADSRVIRLTLALPAGEELVWAECPMLAISPGGTNIAYVARSGGRVQLYLRAIDSLQATALAGTESATCPFFSPDGQWIGFFAGRKLNKISLASGLTQTLCDAATGRDGSWAPDGSIYFAASFASGLSKVSADGGSPTEVTTLDRAKGEVSHRWTQVLPDGKGLMFGVWTGPGRDEMHVYVQKLDSRERTLVVQGGVGRYVRTGHVVYSRGDELFAAPFDLDRLRVSGAAVRLASAVGHYALSDLGDLVYAPANPERNQRRLVWVSRDGQVEPLGAPERAYRTAALSPDGRYAAVDIMGGAISLWIYDLSRTTLTPLQTGPGSSQWPRWTPDGKRIVYRGTRTGSRNLWWKTVDDATNEERLTTGEAVGTPGSWSADGQWFVYATLLPATGVDVWALPAGGDRKPHAVVSTAFDEGEPRLSPDGRWLAYTSDEPGRIEVFVQPFAEPGGRTQISTNGGRAPVWSRDGRELFFLDGERMMAVDITTAPTFMAGAPRLLLEGPSTTGFPWGASYDVSPDGLRFLRVQPLHPDLPANQIHVVLNWFEELRRRVPIGDEG